MRKELVPIQVISENDNLTDALRVILKDSFEIIADKTCEKKERDKEPAKCIVVDLCEPSRIGLQGLNDIIANAEEPVLAILEKHDIRTRREVMATGIYDYIDVPLDPDRVVMSVKKAVTMSKGNDSKQEV